MLNSFLYMQRDLERDNGHFLILFQRKSGILTVQIVHKVNGTESPSIGCKNLVKADIQFSVPRVHCPEVSSKAKVMENCRYTIVPIWKRLKLFFAQLFLQTSSVFTEQSQKCAKSTKPFATDRGNPLSKENQVPHSCQGWSRQKCLWIVMTLLAKIFYCNSMENELESCHSKTNWANFVWMQNSWMLLKSDSISWRKDTGDLTQFKTVACREYTLPREEEASQPKGWIRGNTKIGPVLEVATRCSHGKYGVEIRIMSMNKDTSHSWVRISHGSNKFVTNLNNNEQEISEV